MAKAIVLIKHWPRNCKYLNANFWHQRNQNRWVLKPKPRNTNAAYKSSKRRFVGTLRPMSFTRHWVLLCTTKATQVTHTFSSASPPEHKILQPSCSPYAQQKKKTELQDFQQFCSADPCACEFSTQRFEGTLLHMLEPCDKSMEAKSTNAQLVENIATT